MREKLLTILIALLVFSIEKSNSQNLNFGLKGGYDIVNIHMKPTPEDSWGPSFRPMLSYNVNCCVSYRFTRKLEFTIEPGYIQKGGVSASGKSRTKLGYVQIPFFVSMYPIHRIYFSAGPEFSSLISAIGVNPASTVNISSTYRKNELSALIGVNYLISQNFIIELRYNHGLTSIAKSSVLNSHFVTSYFQFSLCYKL